MKLTMTEGLAREMIRFDLRFTCEDCAHFDEAHERCAHGYPTLPHRRGASTELVIFCKEFELT